MNMRDRQSGVSLIELMVGLVIGLIAVLVMGQVLSVFEGQKRTSTGGSDAQTNGAIAITTLEQEIAMAGFGFINAGKQGQPGNMLCPKGVNIYYNGSTISSPTASPSPPDGGLLAPVRIVDGGTGADAIVTARADSEWGALVNTVRAWQPGGAATKIDIDTNIGWQNGGQLFLIGATDGSKVCTLLQTTSGAVLAPNNNDWRLDYSSGSNFPYNPADLNGAFPGIPAYAAGDKVVSLGYSPAPSVGSNLTAYRGFLYRSYQVTWCSSPQLTPQLTIGDRSQTTSAFTCANSQPLTDQIVDLQAQYGVAPANSQTVDQWLDATGDWAADKLTSDRITRIKAIRVAVVARSPQYEKDVVSPAQLDPPWAGGPQFSTTAVDPNGRHFRYRTYTTVVPLKNVIWGNLP